MTACATWIKPPGPVASGLRIGLLGGSFNPAHEGHLHVSEVALKRLGLDYVWWLVSPQNPLKAPASMAPFGQRIASARAIAGRHPRLCVSDIESEMGTRYTIDTVIRLKQRFPQLHFVWLMGSDNLLTFHRWRHWLRLAETVPIAIIMRPGTTMAPLSAVAPRRFAALRKVRSERALATSHPPALAVLDAKRSEASATALRGQGLGWFKQRVLH
ncbi:MAG TPA: nicotinate-nucleotide adenylyltransferase [Rhizomicrobium sp.]|jgi:nicotinate-nucleotide adenylyltransferase|nr:nicotinate-nucleotide adenylyltransferase [Rhizomicrobium sp.]